MIDAKETVIKATISQDREPKGVHPARKAVTMALRPAISGGAMGRSKWFASSVTSVAAALGALVVVAGMAALVAPETPAAAATLPTAGGQSGRYRLLATIRVPGNLAGGFDISWVDPVHGRYYLADRTSTPNTGRVDVIDANRDAYLYSIRGFAGNLGNFRISGPNGVLTIPRARQLWAGDARSNAMVVNLRGAAAARPDAISTGGTGRADELAYDPRDHIIMIANGADTPPFAAFISQRRRKLLGRLPFPQSVFPDKPGTPAVGHGLEQSVWDAATGRFYISVPAAADNPDGEVDEVDPLRMKVTRVFPIHSRCHPAGLALLPRQRLITSCGVVLDVRTGRTLATIRGVRADEIWFNPGDNRVYFGANPVSVVDANSYAVVARIPVGSSARATHSVAVDRRNNHVFVPVVGVGVEVYVQARPRR